MKLTLDKLTSAIEKLGLYVIGGLALIFAFFLSAVSLLHTTAVENIPKEQSIENSLYHIRESIESVIFFHDNPLWNLVLLAASLAVCFLLITRVKKISVNGICIALFCWIALLGTIWVLSSQSAPTHDSKIVSTAASSCAMGDCASIAEGRYFHNYSFQLGYVFFLEILMRIANKLFHPTTLLYLEVINVLCLSVINVCVVKINNLLFEDKRIARISAFLLALSAAPIISCTFIYSIIPGMMFAILALYFELCYLKKNNVIFAILSIICIALAMMIKSNYLIWLIAILSIAFVAMFRRKRFVQDIAYMVAAACLAYLMQPAVQTMYENRIGTEFGASVPYISWIAMGLNESPDAPGWYNYVYTLTNFENSDFDPDVASEKSAAVIKERAKYFLKNPQYANDFMYTKIASQWNETSYESIWNNAVRGQYKEKGKIAGFFCGKGAGFTKRCMDIFAQLVFFGFALGCVFLLKRKEFLLVPFPLVFLGGFLYQMISEAKSQYILPYFIVMTGFAAFGIVCICDIFMAHIKKQECQRLCKIFKV